MRKQRAKAPPKTKPHKAGKQYESHPAADIFPDQTQQEFEPLKADIGEHGLREPIVLHDGRILDGRHRYRACRELGIVPRFEQWDGDGDAVSYVISKNLQRRHLKDSQRAMCAARMCNLTPGRIPKDAKAPVSAERAAKLWRVSRDSVKRCQTVLKEGTPKLQEALAKGTIAPLTAANLAKLPKEKQDAAAESEAARREILAVGEPSQEALRRLSAVVGTVERRVETYLSTGPVEPISRGLIACLLRSILKLSGREATEVELGIGEDKWTVNLTE